MGKDALDNLRDGGQVQLKDAKIYEWESGTEKPPWPSWS